MVDHGIRISNLPLKHSSRFNRQLGRRAQLIFQAPQPSYPLNANWK